MYSIEVDEMGPMKVLNLYFPKTDFKAIVVVHNTALGPSVGGVRISTSVTTQEVLRLARTMTLKNSIAGLPHGGGKAGIIADPEDPGKEQYMRMFAKAIRDLNDYIPGPDMGSDEESMAWIYDEIERAVGLPEVIGGIPLDELGATGFGLAECAEVVCPYSDVVELKGARVAIQGFGSVGKAAARFLTEKGAILVAVSDSKGTIHNPDGIDVQELIAIKSETGRVINYKSGTVKDCEELFFTDCDILIPAAIPDVINRDNVDKIKAKLILQGANIPATREAEIILHKKGILSIPDFIANAGGVIMAAMEYAKKTEKEAFEAISTKIKTNTRLILKRCKECREEYVLPREIAEEIAKERVMKAMKYREC